MKKMMKKLMAMTAALLMVISLFPATGVKAAATIDTTLKGSVTINKVKSNDYTEDNKTPVEGATFSLYKVASLTTGSDGQYAKWVIDNNYKDSLSADSLGSYDTKEIENKASDILKTISKSKISANAVGTTNEEGTVTIPELELGYYLVVETGTPTGYVASKPFFVSIPSTNENGTDWEYNITVEPKNEEIPPVVKESDVDTVGYNKVVHYTITGTIPTYDEGYDKNSLSYVITDTLSKGLTYNENTVEVKVGKDNDQKTLIKDTDYDLTITNKEDKTTTIRISLHSDIIADNPGAIVVTYSATVNKNAIIGSDGNKNEVEVVYSNGPNSQTTGSTTENKVYSFAIKVDKKGEDGALAGAEFELYTNQECSKVASYNTLEAKSTDEEGHLTFSNLEAGTYYLKETKAPKGYTLLTTPVKIVISKIKNPEKEYSYVYSINNELTTTNIVDDGIVIVGITNHKGFSLPATGGMGTYLFTIGGLVIMAGAAIALISMKKKNRA